jgi:threonine/homoserine/homoserine lactone efflux protein
VLTLLAIGGALLAGALSPGPSFVYVTRLSLAKSRAHGAFASIGMGLGGLTFAVLAMAGLGTLLHYAEWAYVVLKIAGGAYLLWLGIRMWLHAGASLDTAGDPGEIGPAHRALWPALFTQLSNPKAIVVYGSIFAALLPQQPPPWLFVAILLEVLVIETGWYLVVTWLMSSRRPRALYARAARAVDRVAGGVLGALGIAFAADGVRSALR